MHISPYSIYDLRTETTEGKVANAGKPATATRKFDLKRANLTSAAVYEFTERGLKGTRIADVAASVGLATTSVTYYFKRKEDLAVACFLHTINEFRDMARHAATMRTRKARLRAFLSAYFALRQSIYNGDHPPLMLFNEIRALEGEQSEQVFTAYTEMYREIRSLLLAGKGSGDRVKRQAINAQALLLLSHILWVPVWIERYTPADYPRLTNHILDLFQDGILPPGESWSDTGITRHEVSRDSRDTFLRAASEMINDLGYRGASLDRIALSLDLTKGSFYHHYESKEALAYACSQRTFAIIDETMAEANIADNAASRINHILSNLVRLQLEEAGPLLTMGTISTLAPEQRGEILDHYRTLTHRLADILIDGIVEGSIRPVDPLLAAEMIVQTINVAHELPRWVAQADARSAARLLVYPLFCGITGQGAA